METYEQEGVCCGEREELLSFPGTAYVKISEGCDSRCSFCAIRNSWQYAKPNAPRTLSMRYNPWWHGGVEINLVGQDSASYGMDGSNPVKKEIWSQFDGSGATLSPLAQLLQGISRLEENSGCGSCTFIPTTFRWTSCR